MTEKDTEKQKYRITRGKTGRETKRERKRCRRKERRRYKEGKRKKA